MKKIELFLCLVRMNPGVPPLSILQIMFPRMLAYDLIQLSEAQVQIQLTAAQV